MDARENQLNTGRFDRDYAPPPAPGRGYAAVDTENPDAIKSRIDRTRAEMDETVDALQHKLSLDYLIDRTIGSFRDSAGRSRVFDMVRENPIPAAMIGLGVTWLLIEQSGGGRHASRVPNRYPDEIGRNTDQDWLSPGAEYYERRGGIGGRMGGEGKGMIGKAGEKVGDVAEQARDAAGNLIDRVRDRAGNLVDRVRDTVSGTGDGASRLGHEARERVSQIGHDARERVMHAGHDLRLQAERARNGFWHTYQENPLIIGAGAICLGLLLGLSVPTTRAENRLMGETSDELGRKARKLGEDVVHSTEKVAEKAVAAAKDAARNSGSDDLVEKTRAAVTTAASTVQQEARKEGQNLASKTGIDKLGDKLGDLDGDSQGSDTFGGASGTAQKQDQNRPAQPGQFKPGGGSGSAI